MRTALPEPMERREVEAREEAKPAGLVSMTQMPTVLEMTEEMVGGVVTQQSVGAAEVPGQLLLMSLWLTL